VSLDTVRHLDADSGSGNALTIRKEAKALRRRKQFPKAYRQVALLLLAQASKQVQ